MADSDPKKPKLTGTPRAPRIQGSINLEVKHGMEERLDKLNSRIQRVKSVLGITVRTPMGNVLMMERLVSAFEECERSWGRSTSSNSAHFVQTAQLSSLPEPSSSSLTTCTRETQTDIAEPYILAHGENTTGRYDIHTTSKVDEDYFVSSTDSLRRLVATMAQYGGRCPLCGYNLELSTFSVQKHGHVVRTSVDCAAGHSFRWHSSSTIGGKSTANLR